MTLHVLYTPMREISREPGRVRWCFKCRKRLLHELVVSVPDEEMSYYGPSADLECVGCRQDNADFLGCFRDGPRYVFGDE